MPILSVLYKDIKLFKQCNLIDSIYVIALKYSIYRSLNYHLSYNSNVISSIC